MPNPFTVSQMRPIRDGMTISRKVSKFHARGHLLCSFPRAKKGCSVSWAEQPLNIPFYFFSSISCIS